MQRRPWLEALWVFALPLPAARANAYVEFFRAIELDNVDAMRGLLARGVDPNTADEKGQVGLFLALRTGSLKVAELLVAHPELRVDQINAHDETPLMMAALRGLVEPAQRLLARGARADRDGWTPLHYAACAPAGEVTRLLLARQVRVDTASPTGATALMMAARYGSEESVDALLAAGASTKATDHRGQNAAQYARLAGRERLASRLDGVTR